MKQNIEIGNGRSYHVDTFDMVADPSFKNSTLGEIEHPVLSYTEHLANCIETNISYNEYIVERTKINIPYKDKQIWKPLIEDYVDKPCSSFCQEKFFKQPINFIKSFFVKEKVDFSIKDIRNNVERNRKEIKNLEL